jgi:hypothetical protein
LEFFVVAFKNGLGFSERNLDWEFSEQSVIAKDIMIITNGKLNFILDDIFMNLNK